MASEVTAVEARRRFGRILNRAAAGEEITITRRGKPVARLGPPAPARRSVAKTFARFRALRRSLAKQGVRASAAEINRSIAAGRHRRSLTSGS